MIAASTKDQPCRWPEYDLDTGKFSSREVHLPKMCLRNAHAYW